MKRPLLAEFAEPEPLLAVVRALAECGHSRVCAYSPLPIEGLAEALPQAEPGEWSTRIARLSFAGGVLGGATIFLFQTWAMAWDWTLDVGGRAPFSWPAFIVPTFECTILGAALTAYFSWMGLCGFPRPHHPIFEFPAFARASADRMFVLVELDEPGFTPAGLRALVERFEPLEVYELPR